ncbi:hypothetical protein BDV06DRAFT_219534 [Aspergillus oleicola]
MSSSRKRKRDHITQRMLIGLLGRIDIHFSEAEGDLWDLVRRGRGTFSTDIHAMPSEVDRLVDWVMSTGVQSVPGGDLVSRLVSSSSLSQYTLDRLRGLEADAGRLRLIINQEHHRRHGMKGTYTRQGTPVNHEKDVASLGTIMDRVSSNIDGLFFVLDTLRHQAQQPTVRRPVAPIPRQSTSQNYQRASQDAVSGPSASELTSPLRKRSRANTRSTREPQTAAPRRLRSIIQQGQMTGLPSLALPGTSIIVRPGHFNITQYPDAVLNLVTFYHYPDTAILPWASFAVPIAMNVDVLQNQLDIWTMEPEGPWESKASVPFPLSPGKKTPHLRVNIFDNGYEVFVNGYSAGFLECPVNGRNINYVSYQANAHQNPFGGHVVMWMMPIVEADKRYGVVGTIISGGQGSE